MCGRFNLITDSKALFDFFEILGGKIDAAPRYNIAPTQDVLTVRVEDSRRTIRPVRWGLIPSWSKGPDSRYSMINARAETVATKPAYRSPFKHRRCLIPATGFYEWKPGDGKQPYHIHRKDSGLMAFAGLWEHWEKEDKVIESCAIIVTDAKPLLSPIHDRMPVILKPESFDEWLSLEADPQHLQTLLTPYKGKELELYPISRAVNSPKNDGPEVLERSTA